MYFTREEIIKDLAERYYKFLMTLPFDDALYMKGIGEGKRKFLANLHIHLATRGLPIKRKLYSTDFITPDALEKLVKKDIKGLEYEHLIPKGKYINDVCEHKARNGKLTKDFIIDLLEKYLWTATVTEEEHKKLKQTSMPLEWDGFNIKARYELAGIPLLVHEKGSIIRNEGGE
ncbi:hypothetical protein [Bacillus sp. MRMR6]|uniref:hypothetical protein n=1 Tax=Bacillus sp. MRMR6 TaxID=1928617 RepID=UPI000952D9B3|nr:hypothetical protein [Bacillus sp. MRMR6]OLS37729.1 hypothetical protein BTR25_15545 [Bacillus sp. MRMR6]